MRWRGTWPSARPRSAGERARLARAVHDGVLQVLALAQRRGAEPGGDAELGRLAGEQEHALRSLIRRQDALQAPSEEDAVDLAPVLEGLSAVRPPRVSVSIPGTPVVLSAHAVAEIDAVVRACLHNVARHVGEDAPAWVLLEDLGDRVAGERPRRGARASPRGAWRRPRRRGAWA